MNRRKSEKVKVGVSTFLIGGAIGSALAFLFTPKKGNELRRDIKEGFNTTVIQARDKGGKIIDEVVKTSEDIVSKAKKLLLKSSENAMDSTSNIQSGIRNRVNKEADAVKAGINAGVGKYKRKTGSSPRSKSEVKGPENSLPSENVFLINEDQKYKDLEDKNLPTHEGMGRRDLI